MSECVFVWRGSGAKGSRLAGLSLCRSGLLIKSEGQTGGLPPSFSSSLPPSLPSSTATGYSVALWDVGRRRRSRRGEQGADAESLAACGVCKLWLCGQTGDSNRQIRCFWATALSLSFAPYPQTPRGSYSLSACVWLGVAAAVLGLSTFLCVFVHTHLSVCGFQRPGFRCLLACGSTAWHICPRPRLSN